MRANAAAPEFSDVLFAISENINTQLDLIHDYNNSVADNRRLWLFIARDFPTFYVNALEQLLYPDWHAACFVQDPTNASLWGAYGDGHRGVCLKFRTNPDNQGFPTLNLYRVTSWSGSKEGAVAHYSYAPHRFEKMRYTAEFPEIDFFESLGTLPITKLNGFWFAGPNGERSATASRMLNEDENWREEYWRKFSDSFSTKTPEWAHEGEHRLVLHSNLQRFDEAESRKLKYRFTDLAGLAFGIKTTNEDKLRIMQIIERKCRAEDQHEFEFLQAHYSNRTKKIELAPLRLLKMT